MNSKQLYERDIVFFDTFSSLVKNDVDEERILKALAFFKKLAGMNKTIIMCMEDGELPPEVMAPLMADADIYLTLKTTIIEGTMPFTSVWSRPSWRWMSMGWGCTTCP
jgi:flagellar protein FlaH